MEADLKARLRSAPWRHSGLEVEWLVRDKSSIRQFGRSVERRPRRALDRPTVKLNS